MIESLTVFDTRVSIASTVYTYTSHEQASLKTKRLNVRIQIIGNVTCGMIAALVQLIYVKCF